MGQGSEDMMMALVTKRDNAGDEKSTCQNMSADMNVKGPIFISKDPHG